MTARQVVPRVLLGLLLGLALAVPTAAQDTDDSATPTVEPPAGPLRLAEVSPWVDPDGTWTARFDVVGEAPLDSVVVISVRRALTGDIEEVRERLADLRAGGELPAALQSEIRTPIGPLLSPGALTVDLPIRSRSGDSDRALIPNPGVHPVVVSLETAGGEVLHDELLYLNRLPERTEEAPFPLGLLLDVSSPPTVGVDSVRELPPEGRAEAQRAVELVGAHPDVPVTLHPEPHLLDALAADVDQGGAELLERLDAAMAANETLRQTWVDLDLESWAVDGRPADFDRSLVAGQATLVDLANAEPNPRIWGEDPTLGPAGLDTLGGVGVDQLVLAAGQVGPDDQPSEEIPTLGTIEIDGGDSGPFEALVIDPTLQFVLIDPLAVPASAAHQVVTELQAIWFASPTDAVAGAVLPIDDRTPRDTAAALLDALATGPTPTLEVTTVSEVFDRASPADDVVGGDDSPRPLRTVPVSDVGPASAFLAELRPRDRSHAETMGDTPGLVPISQVLLAAQDRGLTAADQRARLDAAANRISTDFAAVRAPAPRSLTVTSRRATVPLQISNELGRPATVELRFSGSRLQIEGGRRRRIEVGPGITRLDVPVTARTSGQFTVAVELRTADGDYLLDATSLRIRSTVFSGVGLLLGGGALVVLALWWFRSWRRSRRTPDETSTSVA